MKKDVNNVTLEMIFDVLKGIESKLEQHDQVLETGLNIISDVHDKQDHKLKKL